MSLLPWDNLQTFINDWMKGLQEIADSIAPDPGADNSMLTLANLPYTFDCTFYASITTSEITNNYSGRQPWLISYRVVLMNNSLRIVNQKYIGKNVMDGVDTWEQLTDAEKEAIETELNAMYSNRNIEVVNNYPELELVTLGSSYGTISIYPRHHSSDGIEIKFPIKNNGFKTRSQAIFGASTAHLPEINSDGYYEPDAWSADYSAIGSQNDYSLYGNIIAVFDNDTEASRVVDAIGHLPYNAHNDVINYTKSGSEYKLYYGDNYLIYALTDDKIYTYNDLFNGTKQATDAINAWHPTEQPIKTPTYNEVKYSDETDSNHTKPMQLNKFVPDTNGMVYYYELDKDDVWKVRAGLNTINLDPLVLKDVTRNLISYKIFAFDPATLIKTKTPVIVHIGGREIKYNDASIPANYVEELKTIALGSINISKLFGDYRDYAPYTKIELFVPFCGWTTLPSWCIDTTITGEMFVDMWNGSCKAVIKASALDAPDGVVVCEMGGVCAYDVPFVADATGAKAASLLSKVATTAGAVATGNPLAIATSGISLATALNENYTRMMGVVGDGSNINGLDHMFIKLTRVSWTDPHKKARPDAYKRAHGIPCGKQLTLSEGDGFTQINDADITGAMTDREKQMIIDGFRHGLIL